MTETQQVAPPDEPKQDTPGLDDIPPKIARLALEFGLIHKGWTMEDYLVHAVETGGFETVNIWAVQGSGKSCRMLQMGYWIYKDWDLVLKSVVFRPNEFVRRLKEIPMGKRTPCLLWDDIGVHYPSSKFKTDIKQYEAIDSAWAAIRTKCSVIVMSIPLIDRLAKNIKDNLTFEVFLGRNQMELINRIFHLPGLGRIDSNFFKVCIEKPKQFNLYDTPRDVFKEYYEMRLRLTEEALDRLDEATDSETAEGYVTVLEAAKELGISPNTVQQMVSRGIISGRKIGGKMHVLEEDFEALKETQLKGRRYLGRNKPK